MKRLRIAVIGAGSGPGARARGWIETVAKLTDHFDLCAICDINPAVAEEISAKHGVKQSFTNVAATLDEAKPDLALILVPTDGQSAVAVEAAKRGINIITEIPYGITLEVGDAIRNVCQQHGVVWEIAEQVWLWPQEQLKAKIVETGYIGKVSMSRLWYASGAYHGFNAVRLILRDSARRVLAYVTESETDQYLTYGGEQSTTVVWEAMWIEYMRGTMCLYERAPRPFSKHSKPNHWEIDGSSGHIAGRDVVLLAGEPDQPQTIREQYLTDDGEQVLDYVYLEGAPDLRWDNPYQAYRVGDLDDVAKAEILTNVHRAIVDKTPVQYGPEGARADLELSFAMAESQRLGNTWMDVPLPGPTELSERIERIFVETYGHDPIAGSRELLEVPIGRLGVWWPAAQWL